MNQARRRWLGIVGLIATLYLVAMALSRWAEGGALPAALAVWMVLGAGPLGAWWWYESTARDTRDPARPMPPGFVVVAGLVVFSAGATATIAGLAVVSSVLSGRFDAVPMCVVGWEICVVLAVVAFGSSRPRARRVVVITSVLDIAVAVWGTVQLSPRIGQPMAFTPVLLALGVAMHGLRGAALLAMLRASRAQNGAERATAPSTA